ncbi:MAG: HD domain-containing protein [Dehalococcoidia bacterium]|nr:MAG: HD domain-containing protein [Dehalococcoidia bacterium]
MARSISALARYLAAVAVAAPLLLFGLFRAFPGWDAAIVANDEHFWIVGGTSLAALLACTVVVASARSLRETRLLFLALAFVSIAGIFSVHGLMTPGMIADEFYASVPVSAWLSVMAGAIFVALSALEMPRAIDRAIRQFGAVIFAWAVIGIATYIVLSIEVNEWLNGVPTDEREVQYAFTAAAMLLFAFAIYRYAQAYLFARLPSQAAMVVALALLFQVPPILLWGPVWHVSWWVYHATYAAAFAVLFAGWAIEARRAGSLRVIADALSMRDALAQLNRGLHTHVLELVDAIEAKDVSTLGHVTRVSAYALGIGKQMGLPAHELRSLVLAAQMHDVGKIGTPDAILRKPGRLDEAEFAEVKRHAPRGGRIALGVPALRQVAPVIRAHHERMQGQGYPDGLAGDEIPLHARIIAVADTYDALTSDRPYRHALTHDDAIAEVRRVTGAEFDPRCVAAFLASIGEAEGRAA